MNTGDMIVMIVVAAIVLLAVGILRRNRKNGKCSCGCQCADGCGSCGKRPADGKK